MGRVQCDEYSELYGESGSQSILQSLQDVANFIKKLKSDGMSFNPTWMLLCVWDMSWNVQISTQVDLNQASIINIMLTLLSLNEHQ